MSITVRLWSKEDLAKIGKDMKLTTVFMNAHTFSSDEIKRYPYQLRKVYYVMLSTQDPEEEPIKVYATSPAMARWFVSQEYNGDIEGFFEKKSVMRKVNRRTVVHRVSGRKPGATTLGSMR